MSAIAAPHASRITFRDIEFETPRDPRGAAGEAMVVRAVPIGSPVITARNVLRDRGAHCPTLSTEGVLECSFSAVDAVEVHRTSRGS